MKSGFTLLELVFTLVLLGIISSIAFVKFFDLYKESEVSIAHSFAATLTRTVGNSLWSKSLAMGAGGSIKYDLDNDHSKFYGRSLESYVTIPSYFDKNSVDFSRCVKSGESAAPFIKKSKGGHFNIFCRDGNVTTAPFFVAYEGEVYEF
ncbi:MAG: prepilin-type N-terminal cleavage/methylation domain-containing protein [Epsilonproteobacteria bacterium]|jgi:prepilin-type N-terminal cleavage/methylation domain-containing protein|nr:prepilin-type N-terminal cleavage/methylation domain-containing protein [Campylobacterota bacterium]